MIIVFLIMVQIIKTDFSNLSRSSSTGDYDEELQKQNVLLVNNLYI